jgi:hypothetical protein
LSASDLESRTRTWQHVMEIMATTKRGKTLERWQTAMKNPAYDSIRDRPLLNTHPQDLLCVLTNGTISTNVFLRRVHNLI